jgi:hypothetical protein
VGYMAEMRDCSKCSLMIYALRRQNNISVYII